MLALAVALDRLAGDPARFHPVAAFGSSATAVERVLWRDERRAGAAHTALCVAGVYLLVAALPRRRAVAAVVVWTTLGGRSLERAATALAAALESGDLEGARSLAPTLVGRDPSALDELGLSRAAVESVAENTNDAVVAPLFWAALLGAPGAAAYRAANTLDAMIGHRSERYQRFGWAAASLDDALSWAPARITALLTALCAFRRARTVLATAFGPAAQAHPSPNAGRAEGAFAGALGVQLGGVNRYAHGLEHRRELGFGPVPSVGDIHRAVCLCRRVSGVAVALALLLGRTG